MRIKTLQKALVEGCHWRLVPILSGINLFHSAPSSRLRRRSCGVRRPGRRFGSRAPVVPGCVAWSAAQPKRERCSRAPEGKAPILGLSQKNFPDSIGTSRQWHPYPVPGTSK